MQAIVGIWERAVNAPAITSLNVAQRLTALENAVAALHATIDGAGIPPGNLIKGIFVAPEYLFADEWAGQTVNVDFFGAQVPMDMPRSLAENQKNYIVQQLHGLSRRFPRILIVPGSIAWTKLLNFNEAMQDIETYRRYDQYVTVARAVRHLLAWSTLHNRVEQKDQLFVGFLFAVSQRELTDAEVLEIIREQGIGVPDYAGNSWFRWVRGQPDAQPLIQRAQLDQKQNGVWALVFDPNGRIMRNTCYIMLGGQLAFLYNKQGDFHENFGAGNTTVFIPGAEKGYTEIEGIKFGVEICLDHNIGMLTRQSRDAQIPDIHIISSAWVAQVPNQVRIRPNNGFMLHASSNQAECGVWQSAAGVLARENEIGNQVVAGSTLRYYRINMAIDDDNPLSLEWLFGQPA